MIEMNDIPQETYQALEKLISSDDSPVGIDVKNTHILIIHKLIELERKLDKLIGNLNRAQV